MKKILFVIIFSTLFLQGCASMAFNAYAKKLNKHPIDFKISMYSQNPNEVVAVISGRIGF